MRARGGFEEEALESAARSNPFGPFQPLIEMAVQDDGRSDEYSP